MLFHAIVDINLHICSTPPFLPPSLKGKGKSTLAYAAHIYQLKVGTRGPLLNVFYATVEINLHICGTPPFLPPSLKGKGKYTLAYMQHIFNN